jgi:hypothetical protein
MVLNMPEYVDIVGDNGYQRLTIGRRYRLCLKAGAPVGDSERCTTGSYKMSSFACNCTCGCGTYAPSSKCWQDIRTGV